MTFYLVSPSENVLTDVKKKHKYLKKIVRYNFKDSLFMLDSLKYIYSIWTFKQIIINIYKYIIIYLLKH